MNTSYVTLSLEDALTFSYDVLIRNGMSHIHAMAVAKSVVAGQRDECHSHGMYRLIGCIKTLRSGMVSPDATPSVTIVTPALTSVDAKFCFSQVAFDIGREYLTRSTRELGIAALAINNCFHFSALWQEVESLADIGLAAIAITPSHSCVAPAGGSKPLLGTNPFAFAWPRSGNHPFVFDFATSMIARGDIELAKRNGLLIPSGWAVDEDGLPTNDPEKALQGAMLTFGSYKGSALSIMIELLAGPLIGDLMSFESLEVDQGKGLTPRHGELIIAFSLEKLMGENSNIYQQRAEVLFDKVIDQGARLPSYRRFAARARSIEQGVKLPKMLYNEICSM